MTQERTEDEVLLESCSIQIKELHKAFLEWFKGKRPREELEKQFTERITPSFSHVAPNGQFLKGRANLLHNLSDKYNTYHSSAFDIKIESVKLLWKSEDLVLISYEEWQLWRQSEDDVLRIGRLSTCLLKRRGGRSKHQLIHVHETWLEGMGLDDQDEDGDDNSEDYDVKVTFNRETESIAKKGSTVGEAEVEDDEDKKVRFSLQREKISYGYEKKNGEITEKLPSHKARRGGSPPPLPRQDDSDEDEEAPVAKEGPAQHTNGTGKPANGNGNEKSSFGPPPNASKRRHISPQLTDYAKACMVGSELIGISINGWDIGTGQGPLGNTPWFNAATTNFENLAQYEGKGAHRRLMLPEMVFPAAHVALENRKYNIWLSWDVLDALDAWAKAHQKIPIDSEIACNGVSVLKTEDAALWKNKKVPGAATSDAASESFHSDWTFSSPFAGSMEGGRWEPMEKSGIALDVLMDKTIPILFFDELVLYEDDLHDNGQVQFALKIRVMPTCAFILARMWVRIDRSLLRLRETRVLIHFQGEEKIYRDVCWRECKWKDLLKYDLPTNLKVWCREGNETPALASLLSRLPEVELPEGLHRHAILKVGS